MTIKVLCTLPNASTLINGVKFEPVEGGVQSVDELTQAHIDHFSSITGYSIIDADAPTGDDSDEERESNDPPAPDAGADAAAPRSRGPRKARV
ncbi:TPA: hypothetical protein QDB28_004021 [Burkholderia vietnamiensis]|nr:hypothetical protein [Burkholderia vietnamiensis]